MYKIKAFVNKNYKVVVGIIIGITISVGIGVSAVATKDIVYDNSTSGLTSTNLQGAIDELNTKAITKINEAKNECPDGYECIRHIVAAYTYNSSTCVSGTESTCVQTSCYENKTSGSCPAGTIVKYKVNSSTTKYFHVLHDDGDTITMQQSENTTTSSWYAAPYDVITNTEGPLEALAKLESATSGWTNVNDQTYTMGKTNFNNTNAYTGCSGGSCTTNTYTLGQRTAKARMITLQEATAVGCTGSNQSCPIWMYRGLSISDQAYLTMSADSTDKMAIYGIDFTGAVRSCWYDVEYSACMSQLYANRTFPIRAVVVVNK